MEPNKPLDPTIVKLGAQLQVLEMLVVQLAQVIRILVPSFADNLRRSPANPFAGMGIPGHPEVSDALTSELEDAWNKLRERVLTPPG